MKAARILGQALIIMGICGLIAGCTPGTSSNGEAPAGQATESDAGQQDQSGGSGGWMEGIPASVPKVEFGTFDTEESSKIEAGPQTIYSLYFEGVSRADAEAYISKLTEAGFEMQSDGVNSGLSASGQLKKGEEILIGLGFSWQENGHVDYTINVQPGAK